MSTHIVNLLVENIKRVSAVEIDATGTPVVVIAGQNEQGKSSVLDAIEMALGGKDRAEKIAKKPVKSGAAKGRVVVDLGDIVVTRRFNAEGGTSLAVTSRNGTPYKTPQAILDAMVGKLTFDPLAFASADPKQQNLLLRQLAGINTDALDTKRQDLYNERTLVNRDVTNAEGALAKLPPAHSDVGAVAEDVDPLLKELNALNEAEEQRHALRQTLLTRENILANARAKASALLAERERLEQRLAEIEIEQDAADMAAATASDQFEAARAAAVAAAQANAEESRLGLSQRIADLHVRNRKVSENQKRAEFVLQVTERKEASKELTAAIEQVDQDKADLLANATFPVDGLGVNDDGVTWQGLPFEQASTAVKTRVSVAIGAALNPKLRVLLVRNGNDLDDKSLELLAQEAKARDLQVWLERIAGGDGQTTVVIEDGTIAAQPGGSW